ncbi:hypothetical protein [Mycobacteroides abscessus]|uniref:hypothetical protein n=1 Tax=Mycobacteroides abscessus TaxID=36809 RepID=UPI0009A5FD5D|nr:hypothetical protein [Mycobacteroides abscessus]SKO15423.1 Uncharacterised protein [Mycobacteroides abscessus subsp. bolletii]SKX37346.1 Uncharacterised protein [Mycobacteroides abscessus subsp. bolletii]
MSSPETLAISPDARFKLREILRSIPGSHDQWADIQDVLDTDVVAVDELLNILAAIGATVRTIVVATDSELAQLRRERSTAGPCPGTTRPAYPVSAHTAKENPR